MRPIRNTSFLFIVIMSLQVFATNNMSSNSSLDWGFSLGLLYPTPGGLGINLIYQPREDVRFSAGIGTSIVLTTYGAGVQYFPHKEWTMEPFIGLQISRTSIIDIVSGMFGYGSEPASYTHSTIDFGFDYSNDTGFFTGLAASFLIDAPIDKKVLPYLYLGWLW